MSILEKSFFSDPAILSDPVPYYRALRERGPVWREPILGVFMLSGIDEILEVYSDPVRFSAIVGPLGPLVKLPKLQPGETLTDMIEHRRAEIPMSDTIMTFDPPKHTRHRALMGKLFTPNRLKENEEFMWTLADGLIDEFANRGEIEFDAAYARPFTLLVVADLLGVPREDFKLFRGWLRGQKGNVGDPEGNIAGDQVFANLHPYFTKYMEERRASKREDAMSKLASVRFPGGEVPEIMDVVRLATILFAAGQETTARLLTSGMRYLAEQPALVAELRADPGGITNFVEECLRLESPIKGSFRLVLSDTTLGGVAIPAGAMVMAMVGAANRDPRIFEDPDRFDAKRPNARRNIAFGHGDHFCPGASLARAEARISFERLLARLDGFELVDASKLSYAPTFIIRGLNDLPMRFRRAA